MYTNLCQERIIHVVQAKSARPNDRIYFKKFTQKHAIDV